MKKIYKYSFTLNLNDPDGGIRKFLSNCNIKYSEGILLGFEISDDNPRFNEIIQFLSERNIDKPQIRNEYSKKELMEAPYLKIWLRKYSGYPQPDNSENLEDSYINYTFDTKNFCPKCGSGLVQNNPFYIKKSFQIDKLRLGGVYWEYDTFFITAELKDLLLKEKFSGIEFLPVKNIKTKKVVENIVQLKINSILPADMTFEVKKVIDCNECKNIKSLMKMDSEISIPKEALGILDKDFYLSREFSGDGLLCCRHVLISNRAYKFFCANKIRNICAEPIRFK